MKISTLPLSLSLPSCFVILFSCALLTHARTRPLKILVVETNFPPISSTAVLNQITGLIKEGHQVDIYAKKQGPAKWAHADIKKYNLMNHTLDALPKNLDVYDIIYCMFGYRGKEIIETLKDSTLSHAKIITCFRGSDISKYVQKNSKNCYRNLFIKGDFFLPVCDFFKDKLIDLGCNPQKIIVHHSAIDCVFFPYKKRALIPDKPIRLVSVSRLIKKKGLEYTIKAVAKLIKKYPHLEYTIAGFGELHDQLKQLIDNLGAQNNIKLVGHLSQEKVVALLNKSDIFILPSLTDKKGNQEGIPNSLKEAMAMGLPVISTYHAGIPELIKDGITGFLVPEKNSDALIAKIEYLINNPQIWPSLCQSARKTIETEYEKDALNKKLITLFYSITT